MELSMARRAGILCAILAAVGVWAGLSGCEKEQGRVYVPPPNDPRAYQPVPQHKPLPQEAFAPPPVDYSQQTRVESGPVIKNEMPFLKAYEARRMPRMMVFVNRTIQGDPLPKDGLEELIRIEEKHAATGAVNVASDKSVSGNSNTNVAGGGYTGSFAGNQNVNISRNDKSSFSSGGPAEYSKSTSIKLPADKYDVFGATAEDYEMIEASIVKYFDNSGKVQIKDSEAARSKLDREKVLRIENGDPAAARLLNTELQQDVLIRVTAKPTRHSSWGNAIRLQVKAIGLADARNLGTAFVDMPPQITKTNVNIYTRYLAEELMGEMAKKWSGPADYDPIEVRVYKVAAVDDALKVRTWLQRIKGVNSVISRGSTGGSTTAYATFAVAYGGAPEDLYAMLKEAIGASQGLKAVDLQSNTINLEVTGQLNLTTTTRTTETKTTVEKTVTEEKKVEPINPAPR